jgi:hypothetical protein
MLEKSALAAPASSEDHKDLSFENIKRDALQNGFLSVPRGKVSHLNDRLPVHSHLPMKPCGQGIYPFAWII